MASDLGLFDALAPAPLDVTAVAHALGSSPHGTRLLLDACAALGLVRAEDGGGGDVLRGRGIMTSWVRGGGTSGYIMGTG